MPKGNVQTREETKMTKQEITEIIESKAARYGFEIEENSLGWNNSRWRATRTSRHTA